VLPSLGVVRGASSKAVADVFQSRLMSLLFDVSTRKVLYTRLNLTELFRHTRGEVARFLLSSGSRPGFVPISLHHFPSTALLVLSSIYALNCSWIITSRYPISNIRSEACNHVRGRQSTSERASGGELMSLILRSSVLIYSLA